jgi:hypothetical protein
MATAGRVCFRERPIEYLASYAGAEVVRGEGMKRGAYLVAGHRVLIFVPDWAAGPDQREAIIARQAVLLALDALGVDRALGLFAGAMGLLRLRRHFSGRGAGLD